VQGLVRLLAPGGRLVIVGMAYNHTALDWVISGCGLPASLLNARLRGGKRGPAGMPVKDSAMHWAEAREAAHRLLPGPRPSNRTSSATEEAEDWGSNDLLMGDVLRRHELQVWFIAEHVVDVPVIRA